MQNNRPTVVGILQRHARQMPDKLALVVENQSYTYGQFYRMIRSAAAYLQEMGVKSGDHVVSVARPDITYLSCMYALLGLGAVHIPAENKVPAQRLGEIARTVDARFVISREQPAFDGCWIDAAGVDLTRELTPWEPVPVSDDCAEIIFTTGTTGKSKGVMLSMHCLEVYLAAMDPTFQLKTDSVFVLTTPLNHVGGLHRTHQCMAAGSAIVILDGIRNLRGFFSAIDTYGVTHTYLPPASVKMLLTLAQKEMAKRTGQLQFIYTASAPFPVADIQTLISVMTETKLYQGYGSSECGSVCNCCYNAPGETVNCLGKPYDCVEIKLLDENGGEITQPNQPGKICIRSQMNMLGYYKEPELTASVLKDGFIYTNDLMYLDEKGGLHFAGRGDDVINIKGFKVAPTEVEDVAMRYPGVNECVCIPYQDKVYGSVVKMLVVMNEGETLDAAGMTEYLLAQLEAYKVPKFIEETDEIYRTPNGKIDRKRIIKEKGNA